MNFYPVKLTNSQSVRFCSARFLTGIPFIMLWRIVGRSSWPTSSAATFKSSREDIPFDSFVLFERDLTPEQFFIFMQYLGQRNMWWNAVLWWAYSFELRIHLPFDDANRYPREMNNSNNRIVLPSTLLLIYFSFAIIKKTAITRLSSQRRRSSLCTNSRCQRFS